MTQQRSWARRGFGEQAWDALARDWPPSEVWSLLLGVLQARATRRSPASLREQWESDRFVQPCPVDQRRLHEVEGHLLAAAATFDALELSPVAPLGVCSAVALASQNKILSTARGTEVVSDPTNVAPTGSSSRARSRSTSTRISQRYSSSRDRGSAPATTGSASWRRNRTGNWHSVSLTGPTRMSSTSRWITRITTESDS